MMTRLGLALATAALLAGCGARGGAGSAAPETAPPQPYDGDWQLESGTSPTGKIPVPDQVTLTISGADLAGTSACNQYFGTAEINGSDFNVDQIGGTEMGCPGKRMVAEQRYGEAMTASDTISRDGDRLTITGPNVDLRFTTVVPPEPAALEDTTWTLDSLYLGQDDSAGVSSTIAGARPATLRLRGGGELRAHTGCRSLQGRWSRDGDTIVTVDVTPTSGFECEAQAREQDDHVVKVIAAGFTATVEGRQLTLVQRNGELGLGYRAD